MLHLPRLLLVSVVLLLPGFARAQEPATPAPTPTSTPGATPFFLAAPTPYLSPLTTLDSNVRYTLERKPDPTPEEQAMYARITRTMDEAVRYYNEYSHGLNKNLRVVYDPNVPTADGNNNGSLRFGRNTGGIVATAMHEIAHAVGVGTSDHWEKLAKGGVFTGAHATATLREIDHDPKAVLHCDHQHFWPYGLNYPTEVHSNQDYINHCKMVTAICQDLREAK